MRILFGIAFRNLLAARRRTALLSAAIGLVTLMLVMLLSMARGIEDNLIQSATTLSTGHVNVAGFYKPSVSQAAPLVTEAPPILAIIEANTPGLDYVVARRRGWGKVVSDTSSTQAGYQGVDLAQEKALFARLQLAPERDYKPGGGDATPGDLSRLAEPHTVALFAGQAKRLEVGVGDLITLQTETSAGRTNTLDATVVAVCKDLGLLSSFTILMPTEDVRDLYQIKDDTIGAYQIYLKDITQADAVMQHLRVVLAEQGYALIDHQAEPFFRKFETVAGEDWTGQKLDVTVWEDEVSFLTWVITAFNTITGFVTLVLMAIIAVGIMNALWNAVRERTREIGTMRAIGMGRMRVLLMVLIEALLLGALATTLGAAVGAAIALGIDAAHIQIDNVAVQTVLLSDIVHLVVRPVELAVSIVALTVLTGLSAIWPARHAARLRPITAIQNIE